MANLASLTGRSVLRLSGLCCLGGLRHLRHLGGVGSLRCVQSLLQLLVGGLRRCCCFHGSLRSPLCGLRCLHRL